MFPRIYRMVRSWKTIDQREIGSQIIRAANSIHANIAEGYSKSPADFRRYLGNALGSCDELVSHISDVCRIGLISAELQREITEEYEIIGKQLTRLKQRWR